MWRKGHAFPGPSTVDAVEVTSSITMSTTCGVKRNGMKPPLTDDLTLTRIAKESTTTMKKTESIIYGSHKNTTYILKRFLAYLKTVYIFSHLYTNNISFINISNWL